MAKETEVKKDPFLAALEEVNKKYGAEAVQDGDNILEIDRLRTGSLSLDIATGGGWGIGKIIEVYGPESSGKTTLCIGSAVEAQKAFPDKKIVIIDAEHALDRKYCKNLGLNMKNVLISQPSNGEEGLEILETFISTGRVSLAIIDSIAALVPKAEIDGEMGDSQMGRHARLMSQAMRKLTGIANKTKTTLIFTNQLRDKLGVMFGDPSTTTGGNAMKFYASIRVDIRKKQGDKVNEVVQNMVSSCKIVKNKLAPPFQKCEFSIEFGKGIDKASEILTLGVATKLIERSGSWFSYQGVKIGNGIIATKDILRDNPQLMEEIEDIIRKNISVYDDIEQIAE